MPYAVAILIGYLLGCSSMALYTAKARGVDMQNTGSKNLGTCNALILMGWKAAILVCVHDIGKAVLSVLIARWLFPDTPLIGYVAGVACVLGHIFPFYLKFKGGKGFASYLGMVFALNWKFSIALVIGMLIVVLITDYIVVGTAATVISFPIFLGISTHSWMPVLIACVATAVVLYKHRDNYVKIYNGTEPHVRKVCTSSDHSID